MSECHYFSLFPDILLALPPPRWQNVNMVLGKRTSNRLRSQLWPTIYFWLIYIFTLFFIGSDISLGHLKNHLYDCLINPMKHGYWFTLSLVEVFLIYAATLLMTVTLKANKSIFACICLSYILIFYLIGRLVFMTKEMQPEWFRLIFQSLCLERTLSLGGYFFFGVFCRLYQNSFENRILNKKLLPIFIVLFAVMWSYIDIPIIDRFAGMIGVLIPLSIFYLARNRISSSSYFWNFWIVSGRNTLPVYLTHYFFILILAETIGSYVLTLSDKMPILFHPVILFIISVILGISILWLTLFIDRRLMQLPKLHKFIYGK